MKKLNKIILCIAMSLCMLLPYTAMAAEVQTPTLTEITFKNATIDGEFSPELHNYTITLTDPEKTPTLKEYKIKGGAQVFVTYNLDESKHQTGILVTLEYSNGTNVYTFDYSNAAQYDITSNNNLAFVDCYMGEVYPAINDKDTSYKLYIPSDMTEIKLTAITQDVSAYCEMPGPITLSADQEPTVTITVFASDASTKTYTFDVKRLNKTMDEVAVQMQQEDFTSLLDGEFFYQKPVFTISIISVAGGIVLLAILIAISRRLTVKVSDDDETEFFDAIDESNTDEE